MAASFFDNRQPTLISRKFSVRARLHNEALLLAFLDQLIKSGKGAMSRPFDRGVAACRCLRPGIQILAVLMVMAVPTEELPVAPVGWIVVVVVVAVVDGQLAKAAAAKLTTAMSADMREELESLLAVARLAFL